MLSAAWSDAYWPWVRQGNATLSSWLSVWTCVKANGCTNTRRTRPRQRVFKRRVNVIPARRYAIPCASIYACPHKCRRTFFRLWISFYLTKSNFAYRKYRNVNNSDERKTKKNYKLIKRKAVTKGKSEECRTHTLYRSLSSNGQAWDRLGLMYSFTFFGHAGVIPLAIVNKFVIKTVRRNVVHEIDSLIMRE